MSCLAPALAVTVPLVMLPAFVGNAGATVPFVMLPIPDDATRSLEG